MAKRSDGNGFRGKTSRKSKMDAPASSAGALAGLGAGLKYSKLRVNHEGVVIPLKAETTFLDEMTTLPWHSAAAIETSSSAWASLVMDEKNTTLAAERKFGAGSIVLLTDAFIFSNEALRESPQPELLAHLVGASSTVIFDETHLGTQSQTGIMGLATQYRLHGFFIGLALVLCLYVWYGSYSLLPRRSTSHEHVGTGKDAVSALVNLLRRNIPASQLPRTCVEQYRQVLTATPENTERLRRAMQCVNEYETKPLHRRDATETLRQISRIFETRRNQS